REAFRDCGFSTPHARWLGPLASDSDGVVLWVALRHIVDGEGRALLFDYAASLDARGAPGGGGRCRCSIRAFVGGSGARAESI
ncbi:hypothetical protein AAHH79_37045, partial [Burkholderia pseudomallei]